MSRFGPRDGGAGRRPAPVDEPAVSRSGATDSEI